MERGREGDARSLRLAFVGSTMMVAVKEGDETDNQRKTQETRFSSRHIRHVHVTPTFFFVNIYHHTIIINNNLFMRHRYQMGTFVSLISPQSQIGNIKSSLPQTVLAPLPHVHSGQVQCSAQFVSQYSSCQRYLLPLEALEAQPCSTR